MCLKIQGKRANKRQKYVASIGNFDIIGLNLIEELWRIFDV